MIAIERIALIARPPDFAKRTLMQLGIASALATGTLMAMSAADARTTKSSCSRRRSLSAATRSPV